MITVFNKILKNKASGVYGIYNSVTGKIYIGSAIKLHRRIVDHIYFLNLGEHHSILLQRAWDKYGENAFEFLVLEYVKDKNELVDKEQYWMNLTSSADPKCGYNISPTAGNCLGVRHTEEVKAARSKALTGIVRSAETRARMSEARKGVKIHSDEAKLKISLASKNRTVSKETRFKLSAVWKNRKHSPETIEKLKAKAKLRGNNNKLGTKYTEQAKANMRLAWIERKRIKNNGWSSSWK